MMDIDKIAERFEKDADSPFRIKDLTSKEVLEMVNGAYIARRFFGRSRSWFCHKLNNNLMNGKPAEFTDEEREKLKEALNTMAIELQGFADEL